MMELEVMTKENVDVAGPPAPPHLYDKYQCCATCSDTRT